MRIPKQNLLASILLHLVIFAGVGWYIDFSTSSLAQQTGEKLQYIRSYLYTAPPLPQKPPIVVQKTHTLKMPDSDQPASVAAASASSSAAASSMSSEKQAETLLALLHQAIQNTQRYPASALQMHRQGKVKIGFRLYPDGNIRDLALVQSSQTASLDNAALEAVRLAAPFQKVEKYLSVAKDFEIEVVFASPEENA